jgi:hypothetical protein
LVPAELRREDRELGKRLNMRENMAVIGMVERAGETRRRQGRKWD